MTVGDVILWSALAPALVLFVLFLYYVASRGLPFILPLRPTDRGHRLLVYGILGLYTAVVGGGIWGWMIYQAWPSVPLLGLRFREIPDFPLVMFLALCFLFIFAIGGITNLSEYCRRGGYYREALRIGKLELLFANAMIFLLFWYGLNVLSFEIRGREALLLEFGIIAAGLIGSNILENLSIRYLSPENLRVRYLSPYEHLQKFGRLDHKMSHGKFVFLKRGVEVTQKLLVVGVCLYVLAIFGVFEAVRGIL